jgi:hypothetical protein
MTQYNRSDLSGGMPVFKLRRRVAVPGDQAEALLHIELVLITVIIMWPFEMMMRRILLIRLPAGKLIYPFYKTCSACASRQLDDVSFHTQLSPLTHLRSPLD